LLYHPLVGDPSMCNLPGYLSPELCEGERELSKSDDHWAICVLFYRMVSGEMPFAGMSGAEVLESIQKNGIVFPHTTKSLSPAVMEFIRKSLGATMSERPDGRELNLRFKAILKKQYSATDDMEPIPGVLPPGDRPTVPPDVNAIAIKDVYREAVKRTTRPVPAEDALLLGKDEELLHSDSDDSPEMDFDFDPDLEIDIETEIDMRETQVSPPLGYRGDDISNPSVDFMVLPPILMSSAGMTNPPGALKSEWPPENPMASTKASIDTSRIAVLEQHRMKRKRLVKQVFFNISLGMIAAVALYLFSGTDRFGTWHAEDAIRIADTPTETPLAKSPAESESVPETASGEPEIEARESVAAVPASAGAVSIRMENLPPGAYILVNGRRVEHPIMVHKSAEPLAVNVVVDERIIYSTILLPEGDQVITLPVNEAPKKVKGREVLRARKGKSAKPPIRGENNLGKLSSNPHQLRGNPFLKVNGR
jgi:serine/threonine protein kinase